MTVEYRAARADDVEHIQWALYTALDWDAGRELPPQEATLQHPEALRYHRDWGRPGDIGVIASRDGEVVGVAYCRVFTDDDHGHGYVDAETPEVAIAVRDGVRGEGVGARLLAELAELAAAHRYRQLSLSVDPANPARRLYERVGYRDVGGDEDGVRMVLGL